MAKYNKKREPVRPTEVNEMGSAAFKLSPEEELVSTVLTTFVRKSYYESENEVVERIRKAAEKCSPEFVAKTALYTRCEANMRSSSHLLAGELAKRVSGKEWGSRFYRNICVRPDDMSEILAYYLHVNRGNSSAKKIINAMKKGFRSKLESMDAFLIDKYKMSRRKISLVDLVNLVHPKPTQGNAEAFRRLMTGESLDGLYTTKILEKEKSRAGQKVKTAVEREAARAEAITETLETNVEKMPIMNLLRNLKSIIENTPEQVDLACEILTIPDKIRKSRLLPFRFASAYSEVEKLGKGKSASMIQFESEDKKSLVEKLLAALETAMNIACENIPKLEGNTAILIDHSGSMRGDSEGSSKVSVFSKTDTADIANLFGCMLMQTQDNVYMGLFGDRLISVDSIDRTKGILKNHSEINLKGSGVGPSSEHGLFVFLADAIKNKVRIDNLVIFSDMVIGTNHWYGRGVVGGYSTSDEYMSSGNNVFHDLLKDFRKVNPQCNIISVDLRQTQGTSVFHEKYGTQIAGWSEKIFDVLGSLDRGYKDIIATINKIEL